MTALARNKGKFVKGQSGNPGGRPAALREVIELARDLSVEACTNLAAIARNSKLPTQARVAAWNAILDRAWGKPTQSINLNDERTLDEIPDDELFATLDRIRAEIAGRTGTPPH